VRLQVASIRQAYQAELTKHQDRVTILLRLRELLSAQLLVPSAPLPAASAVRVVGPVPVTAPAAGTPQKRPLRDVINLCDSPEGPAPPAKK
jgi:hypothetical protein